MAATYIVLFTVYGAVLEYSGAGRFFIDGSFAAFGTHSAAAPGRTTTLAGLLLVAAVAVHLATTRELLLLPTDRYVDRLKERYGDFHADAEIEAGGYEGVDAPVKVVAVPAAAVVVGVVALAVAVAVPGGAAARRWWWPTSAAARWPASPCPPRASSPSVIATRSTGPSHRDLRRRRRRLPPGRGRLSQ
jgi:TRAP-type uncharacterized transport system fused permease subunit